MRLFAALAVLALIGCKNDGNSNTDETGLIETDTDTDTDVDTDADTDVDTDADADADTDADTDTDTQPQPCPFSIPAEAIVKDGGQQSNLTDDAVLWACARTTLSVAASNNTIFLENRADLTVTSGGGHTIYVSGNSDVFLTTAGSTIHHDGSARITEGTANTNTIIVCPAGIVFDTTNAPTPGCQ